MTLYSVAAYSDPQPEDENFEWAYLVISDDDDEAVLLVSNYGGTGPFKYFAVRDPQEGSFSGSSRVLGWVARENWKWKYRRLVAT